MSGSIILTFLFLFIFTSLSTPALSQDQPDIELQKTIGGQVYKSNGEPVDSENDGTHVELHIINGGKEYMHLDLNGLQDGWYGITIPDNEWDYGDTFWIEVDGSAWGDQKDRVEDNNVKGVDEWVIYGTGAIWQDIRTVQPQKEAASVTTNLEPGIAFISGIVLLGLGFYFAGPRRKINVDVIVISSKTSTGKGTKDKSAKKQVYQFGYGNPSMPVPIGKMSNVDEHLAVNSVVRVRVRGIVRTPDGIYAWYKPELIGLDKIKEMPILAPDTELDMDKLWYAGGSIKIERGQLPKSGYNRHYTRNIALLTLPFVILSFILAFYSFYYNYPEVPPYLGEGLLFNIILVSIGIAGPMGAAVFGRRAKYQVERHKKGNFTVRKWAVLTAESKFASNTNELNRVDFCGSCKAQVQQNVNICSNCQRNLVSSIEITASEAEAYLAQQPARAGIIAIQPDAKATVSPAGVAPQSGAFVSQPSVTSITPVFAQTPTATAKEALSLPPKS